MQCFQVNNLDEFSMIAGSREILEFEVYEEDGVTPADLSAVTIKWVLSPFGQSEYNILQLNCDIELPNIFTVNLLSSLTQDLEFGKYIHQPVIKDVTGEDVRLGQGIINIIPRIPIK